MKLNRKVLNAIGYIRQSIISPQQDNKQNPLKKNMIYFVSYPKSGRTWVRFMVNSYLCYIKNLELANVMEIPEVLGDSYPFSWEHLGHDLKKQIPYWGMESSDEYELQGSTCILLTRNFYATCCSAYHQAVHRIKIFSGSPSEFIRSPRYGVIKLVTFYNRLDEIIPQLEQFEFVNYDAMLKEPADSLVKILKFAKLDIDRSIISKVVKQASFDNMRRLSQTPVYANSGALAPKDINNPDSYKIRVGGDSKYRELFTNNDIEYINQVVETMLVNKNAPYLIGCWNGRD